MIFISLSEISANEDGEIPKQMLDMLSAQKQAFTFFCIKQGDKNNKVIHSLGLIIETFGEEEDEQYHNNYIVFKRKRTKRINLASLLFRKECLLPQKHKTKSVQEIHNHYVSPKNSNIIKIDDTEDETQLTQVIMVPTKWERNLLL